MKATVLFLFLIFVTELVIKAESLASSVIPTIHYNNSNNATVVKTPAKITAPPTPKLKIDVQFIVSLRDDKEAEISCIITTWNNISSTKGFYNVEYYQRFQISGVEDILQTYQTSFQLSHKLCKKETIQSSTGIRVKVIRQVSGGFRYNASSTEFDLNTFKEAINPKAKETTKNQIWIASAIAAFLIILSITLTLYICKLKRLCCCSKNTGKSRCHNVSQRSGNFEMHSGYRMNNNEDQNRSQGNLYEPIPDTDHHKKPLEQKQDESTYVDVDKIRDNSPPQKDGCAINDDSAYDDVTLKNGNENYADSAYDDVALLRNDENYADSSYDDVALLRNDENKESNRKDEAVEENGCKQYTHLKKVKPELYVDLQEDDENENEEEALLKDAEVKVLPQYKKDGSKNVEVYNPKLSKKSKLKSGQDEDYEKFKAIKGKEKNWPQNESQHIYSDPTDEQENSQLKNEGQEFNYGGGLPKGPSVRQTIYEMNEDGSHNEQSEKSKSGKSNLESDKQDTGLKPSESGKKKQSGKNANGYELADVVMKRGKSTPVEKGKPKIEPEKIGKKNRSVVEDRKKLFEQKGTEISTGPKKRTKTVESKCERESVAI
eukprot:TCONS_00050536-protein